MKSKTTVRDHLTPVRMTIIKKIYQQYKLEKVWRQGSALSPLLGMEIDIATMENNMESP